MKRLLCLISGMNAGGAETFLMKVYRQLDKANYQMDFCINVKDKTYYEDEISELGGKIYRIPSKSENTSEFKRQLTELIKKQKYSHVMRITSNAMGFMDLKVAKKAGAEVTIARSSNSSDGNGLKAYIAHRLGRLFYQKYVDVKVAPSDLAGSYTFGSRTYKNNKVTIIHNGVDVNRFKFNESEGLRLRKELGIGDSFVVGHIGRFTLQKNHMFLLDIFSEICNYKENAVLLLVGEGELEQEIKAHARKLNILDKITFTGIRSDIPELLSAMDVFVFPSFYEGMPNTVIEAQATGLPCVISDTITKEADITDIVKYLSLNDGAAAWAEKAVAVASATRCSKTEEFIKNRYDITSVTEDFTEKIFNA